MLVNPQALELLIDATEHGGAWPESRLATFELACRKMAAEHNDEHLAEEPRHSIEAILEAAGRLCALLLLSGSEGYTRTPGGAAAGSVPDGFVSLDDLGEPPAAQHRDLLKDALSTKLFKPGGETEQAPRHRRIAEFLAGRQLAGLINGGLPARRVLALMTSSVDGRVVTPLRGLSAWLAAHSAEARRLLVEADPVGVGLYGDIAGFGTEDKQRLLTSLVSFAAQGPLFGHARQDDHALGHGDDTARAFRSLASADMVTPLRNALNTPAHRTDHDRTCEFVTAVLAEAEESETEALLDLIPDLVAILRDADRPPRVTARALDSYIHIAPSDERGASVLVELLEAIRDGATPDPGEGLRVTLLEHLYPTVIGAAEVWRCGLPRPGHTAIGSLSSFWRSRVPEYSDERIAELLDALSNEARDLIPALRHSYLNYLPVQLLVRGLDAFGDTPDRDRLFGWLDVAGRIHRANRPRNEDARCARRWLEDRPEVWKGLFLVWLRDRVGSEPDGLHRHLSCAPLLYANPPADFGLWCLDQATALQDSEPALAHELLGQAHRALPDPAIGAGLTSAVMHERVGEGPLARRLVELEDRRSRAESDTDEEADGWRRGGEARRAALAEKEQQRQEGWRRGLDSQLDDLRSNRLHAPNLHALAQVYLGIVMDADEEATPRKRLHDFIGGDEELVDAVMAAIREAIFRADVPTVDETIAWHSESKHSWLAYPVLASLHLISHEDPDRLDRIRDDRKRAALAILYCVSSDEGDANWHERWFEEAPELVLEVLYRCAAPALRAGKDFVPCLNTLDGLGGRDDSAPVWALGDGDELVKRRAPRPRFDGHDDLVHATRLRLLDALPTRASNKQMSLLDDLLARAMRHLDRAPLRELALRAPADR